MEETCHAGYRDTFQFLKLSGLIQCEECKTLTEEDYKTLPKEDCAKCKELEKQAEDSNLPESLRQVFQEARQSEATTSGFLSKLIQTIRSSLAWLTLYCCNIMICHDLRTSWKTLGKKVLFWVITVYLFESFKGTSNVDFSCSFNLNLLNKRNTVLCHSILSLTPSLATIAATVMMY